MSKCEYKAVVWLTNWRTRSLSHLLLLISWGETDQCKTPHVDRALTGLLLLNSKRAVRRLAHTLVWLSIHVLYQCPSKQRNLSLLSHALQSGTGTRHQAQKPAHCLRVISYNTAESISASNNWKIKKISLYNIGTFLLNIFCEQELKRKLKRSLGSMTKSFWLYWHITT